MFKDKREESRKNFEKIISKTYSSNTMISKAPMKNNFVVKTHLCRDNFNPIEKMSDSKYLANISTLFKNLNHYIQEGRPPLSS